MKLLTLIILAAFGFYVTAEEEVDINDTALISSFVENGERVEVYWINGKRYKMNDKGKLILLAEYIDIIGDRSLQSACLNGESFDPSIAAQDMSNDDLYYTIVNNTDAEVVVVTTSAGKSKLVCSTPVARLQRGECVKVYDDNRLHTLAQVSVNGNALCGGWKDNQPVCELGNSYAVNVSQVHPPLQLLDNFPEYASGMYEMRVVAAQADCLE